MNARKVKLALTVGLINQHETPNALNSIKNLMSGIKEEVGTFLGLYEKRKAPLERQLIRSSYALQYENCTLDIDLIMNRNTNNQYIQGFYLSK
ncbi:MAG: hypothetical protein GY705_07590 [Bacteroidetes bacterium]|nr:hypothetical protein [Bacteroidota bacterium]